MKTITPFKTLAICLILALAGVFKVNAQNVYIPDSTFKSILLATPSVNVNNDNEISVLEASYYQGGLNLNSAGISDMTGIEAFSGLTVLLASNNSFDTLIMGTHPNLSVLQINHPTSGGNLKYINVDGCSALSNFHVTRQSLTSINVALNSSLTQFKCFDNALGTLDLSYNDSLYLVDAGNCSLDSIIFPSQNTTLKRLYVGGNNLTSIDISGLAELTELYINDNDLTRLDLANNPKVYNLYCYDNDLYELNLDSLNINNVQTVRTESNPNLYCIQVADSAYADTNWTGTSFTKDAQQYYSETCGYGPCTNVINFADPDLKAHLLTYGVTLTGKFYYTIDTDGDGEICESEANSFAGGILIPADTTINDLSGLEHFTSIVSFVVSVGNGVTNFVLPVTDSLKYLNISDVNLLPQVIKNHAGLKVAVFRNNLLSNIDLSNKPVLEELSIIDNFFSIINLSSLSNLVEVNLKGNNLTHVDVSSNPLLNSIMVSDNTPLTSMNLANGNNLNFTSIISQSTPNLSCVEVDDTAYSDTVWVNSFANGLYVNFGSNQPTFSTNCTAMSLRDEAINALNIYPNPAQDIIYIDGQTAGATMHIIDLNGRVLKSFSDEYKVDVSSLTPGVYILSMEANDRVIRKKFVKK